MRSSPAASERQRGCSAVRTQEQSLAAIEALLETCEAESTVATVALKPDQVSGGVAPGSTVFRNGLA